MDKVVKEFEYFDVEEVGAFIEHDNGKREVSDNEARTLRMLGCILSEAIELCDSEDVHVCITVTQRKHE